MAQEYKYQCIDNSLITPFFKKWVVAPLLKFIPWEIPANIITMGANVFIYIALYLTIVLGSQYRLNYIIVPILITLYAIFDHIDGMQAKRTKTSSALGEFCDHYLDIFNNGIINIIIILMYDVGHLFVVIFVLVTSYIAHMAVIYEEYKTKWLVFEKIGSLEGVFLAVLVLLLGSHSSVYNFLMQKIYINFTMIEVFLLLSAIGSILTFIKTTLRIGKISRGFVLFTIILIIIGLISNYFFSAIVSFMLIALYSGSYIGRLMQAHLVDGIERTPDFFVPIYLIFILLFALVDNGVFLNIIICYLLVNNSIIIYNMFTSLRQYWVWKNLKLSVGTE